MKYRIKTIDKYDGVENYTQRKIPVFGWVYFDDANSFINNNAPIFAFTFVFSILTILLPLTMLITGELKDDYQLTFIPLSISLISLILWMKIPYGNTSREDAEETIKERIKYKEKKKKTNYTYIIAQENTTQRTEI